MEIAKSERLCQNVASSVHDVRQAFRSATPVPKILDRFWRLQDDVYRLLEALTDSPVEAAETLRLYPSLLKDVVDVLEFTSKLQSFRNIPALREAGESINNSLLEIQYLKQSHAMAAAV